MIFYARATRDLRRPSLDARSGDQLSPIPEEITSKLEGIIEMDDGRSMRAVKDSRLACAVSRIEQVRGVRD
jgi:hypothetical protein